MAKQLLPPLNTQALVGETARDEHVLISGEMFRYMTSLHAVVADLRTRFAVPADAGAWPTLSQIPTGDSRLWKNGANLRLYANDGGTLKFVAIT